MKSSKNLLGRSVYIGRGTPFKTSIIITKEMKRDIEKFLIDNSFPIKKAMPFFALALDKYILTLMAEGRIPLPKGDEENAKIAISEYEADLEPIQKNKSKR